MLPKDVTEQQLVLSADRVPVVWLDALRNLKDGEQSQILDTETGFLSVALADRLPAEDMDLEKAYAVIEERLLTPRLQATFDAWLANRLVTADIWVAQRLMQQEAAEGDELPAELQPVKPAPEATQDPALEAMPEELRGVQPGSPDLDAMEQQ